MMGNYTFKWEHPADEVYVTGTFDDWGKTVKLDKKDNVFEKTVHLPKTGEKIYYKFVVDGEWVTNDSAPSENDPNGITNNFLHPEDIKEQKEESKTASSELPGAFPETPGFETPSTEPQTLSVSPIPATEGAGNPISLAPGEKVPDPSTLTSNTISSTVKTDPESYEKSDAGPPQLGPVVTPEHERDAKGDPGVTIQSAAPTSTTAELAGQVPKEPHGVPEVVTESQKEAHAEPEASASPDAVQEKKEVEKELLSEVPTVPATSESPSAAGKAVSAVTDGAAAAGSAFAAATYAAKDKAAAALGLNQDTASPDVQKAIDDMDAGGSGVPRAVSESIEEAHRSPEAAANPEAVSEKKEVEDELLSKIKATDASGEPAPAPAASAPPEKPAEDVPEVVAESIAQAHQSPEAAANPEAVTEKAAVEEELKKEIKPTDEAGEPAPTQTAALSATAPGDSLPPDVLSDSAPLKSSSEPEVEPPTALSVPPSSDAAKPPSDLNAPADKPAQSAATEASRLDAQPSDSRDVSPMTRPATTGQTQPIVTTGAETGTTEQTSKLAEQQKNGAASAATPSKPRAPDTSVQGTPESTKSTASRDTEGKKKNRMSGFFGKLKGRLHSK